MTDAAKLIEALKSIRRYGFDTLSGRTDGPDDRKWQRDAVKEMAARADAAIKNHKDAQLVTAGGGDAGFCTGEGTL